MSASPPVRRATPADVPALASMLARAFLDDPVAAWAFQSERLRPAALERFQELRLRQLLGDEEVWMSEDATCAALWAPPERWKTTLRQDLELARCLIHPRLIARMPLIIAALLGMERRHPARPLHYYLAVLGTDPEHQGRGLGSALLRQVLQECDRDGLGAYLESSKQRNIDFYARHGFRVVEQIRLLRGPPMWRMWREPRA